jgi:hypothetical protein
MGVKYRIVKHFTIVARRKSMWDEFKNDNNYILEMWRGKGMGWSIVGRSKKKLWQDKESML